MPKNKKYRNKTNTQCNKTQKTRQVKKQKLKITTEFEKIL